MTNRENFLNLIRFKKPCRIIHTIPDYSIHYLGHDHTNFDGVGQNSPAGTVWTDYWGTVWRKEQEGVMGFPIAFPLSDPSSLKGYRWPDADDERISGMVYDMAEGFPGGDLILSANHRGLLWERAYMLVGMENLMMLFYENPCFARELLRNIMDFQLAVAAHYIRAGIELVYMGDDLGTQNGLLLSPKIINEFLLPEYERIFTFYKQHGIPIDFHSCGHVEPLLGMFMDLGVDILNPVQASANNLAALREATRGKMALQGGIHSRLLLEGPADKIEDEVREKIELLGREGGYICQADQWFAFPEENLNALRRAVNSADSIGGSDIA